MWRRIFQLQSGEMQNIFPAEGVFAAKSLVLLKDAFPSGMSRAFLHAVKLVGAQSLARLPHKDSRKVWGWPRQQKHDNVPR